MLLQVMRAKLQRVRGAFSTNGPGQNRKGDGQY